MPAKKAAVPKADAAANEANDIRPVVEFLGVELSLPPKLPGSFGLRLGRLQHLPDNESPGALYGLLSSVVGDDDLVRIMDAMDAGESTAEEVLPQLIATVMGAYGAEPGEQKASDGS